MHREVTLCRTTRTGFTPNELAAPHHPPLIYGKPGYRTFRFLANSSLFCSLSPAAAPQSCAKINRHTGKIEHLVSHRKQRTAPQINRHTSRGPRFTSLLFTFPFSLRPLRCQVTFTGHSPLPTNHFISNRKLEILDPHLTPAISTNHPVLIANFEPTVCLYPAPVGTISHRAFKDWLPSPISLSTQLRPGVVYECKELANRSSETRSPIAFASPRRSHG
jgi:hypothetical protein